MTFHLHRAKQLIDRAYSPARWQDPTPAKAAEKRAWAKHKRCVYRPARENIARYRAKAEREFEAHREAMKAEQRYLGSITPPGPQWLAALRQCESGGDYSTNTGNGFFGAYQFTLSTWASVGGSGNPAAASPAEQDYRAALLYRTGGPGHWPNCP